MSQQRAIDETSQHIQKLEEQLAQREAEIARLSNENQLLTREKDQRTTELQIINNIGQTLTEGLDLQSTIEHVGERLRDILEVQSIAIAVSTSEVDSILAQYIYHKGQRIEPNEDTAENFKFGIRIAARWAGRSWVANTNEKYLEKYIRKFALLGFPKSFASFPLLSGGKVIGGITISDDEREDAFTDLPIAMLETISSNMGTAFQNVRLFNETQRLLKETDQRATELQIINNIGQILTEGGDLNSAIKSVGERLRDTLKLKNIAITIADQGMDNVVAQYFSSNNNFFAAEYFSLERFKRGMRLSMRGHGRSWVVNRDAEKSWRKFAPTNDYDSIPKSFVMFPLLAGHEIIGAITIADYEMENAFTNITVGLLETIASNMGTAIQNARLFDETQRLLKETELRATELQIINNIGQTLTEGLDLNSTLERVGERLLASLMLNNIGIVVFDPKSEFGISHYLYVKGKRVNTQYFSLEKFKASMRLSMRGGGRSWVVNTNAEKIWRKYGAYGDEIAKSFVMLPLLAGKEVIGGITILDYERENAFTDLPVSLIETIASNMGTAIQNVRLFDETQRLLKETEQRATELQIINNVGQTLTEGLDLHSTLEYVTERLCEVLRVENIGITIADPNTDIITAQYFHSNRASFAADPDRFSFKKYRMGIRMSMKGKGRSWVVNTNVEKSWRKFAPSIEENEIPKTFILLPLLVGNEAIGGITIADFEREDAFSDISVSLLETIASNMGSAIQNVRLFDETQRLLKETEQRATELQIINNIGQTLTEGGDLESMIQRVGERIQEALNINNIAISIFDKHTERVIAPYMYRNGEKITLTEENFDLHRYKTMIRASARRGGVSWVVKGVDMEKVWRKSWRGPIAKDVPKSMVVLPLSAGREIIGGISLADYEKEDAFTDLSINLLETIASNMGTAIQNVRLFDETQRLFKEAEESRATAEQANKAKSTFLANMSHELRTPLNAIIGFTRIVKKKAEGALPEKQIENLDKVLVSSEHLLGLINTVLDIAKIEAGRMDVIPSKFSLHTLADQCTTLASPLLKPNVTLEKQVDETLGFIFSDQDKIKQIVLNLLSNAAKFTHEGKILLSIQNANEENVSIAVTDSGIGISEEALGRVFEEFQQADNTTTRQYGGTGLGLTISRNLARLLGGDLTATSELSKGSTFTLTIPTQYGKKSASSSDLKPDSVQSIESQAEEVPAIENGNRDSLKTVLIVEDIELNIDVLTQLLENDYNLLIATDGAQGVSMAQENNPDLILMDISLPVIDGYEATRRIRTTMKTTPIIGLSAHAMSGDAEKATEAGCNEYMTKPIDEELLIKKLNQYLR